VTQANNIDANNGSGTITATISDATTVLLKTLTGTHDYTIHDTGVATIAEATTIWGTSTAGLRTLDSIVVDNSGGITALVSATAAGGVGGVVDAPGDYLITAGNVAYWDDTAGGAVVNIALVGGTFSNVDGTHFSVTG